MACRVRYVGSPEHKDIPSFAGQPRPRADASLCPRTITDAMVVTEWLRSAIRRGATSAVWEGTFPKYVWHKENETYFEARLVKKVTVRIRAIRSVQMSRLVAYRKSMPNPSFEFEWEDAGTISGPELSATWARLKILSRESVITRVLDGRAKTVRDSVYVPLYPLAEWFATNWWFLANEFRNPEKQLDPEFRRRHSLRTGREGYAFPDLEVVSSGPTISLVWNRYVPESSRVEFLDQGRASLDTSAFRQDCRDLIDSVIRRLTSLGIENTLLQDEWSAIQATEEDEEELRFCEIAAGLGWDPYDLDDQKSDDVIQMAQDLGEFADEAVQALNPADLQTQSAAILTAIEHAKRKTLPLRSLKTKPINPIQTTLNAPPWHVGYDWAHQLRNNLGLDGQPLLSMSTLAEALGEDEDLVRDATQPVEILNKTPLVDGLVAVNHDESVSFAFRSSSEQGKRFRFCRALGEVLAYPWSSALITKSHSERQQRNRAFAAEFLAPSYRLREKVTRSVVDGEEIDDLADEFGVSPFVIEHQLQNHHIARFSEATIN